MYSARDELFESLTGGGDRLAPGEAESANNLIDNFAHELAKRIRSLRDSCEYAPDETEYRVMSGSANLIDPDVTS